MCHYFASTLHQWFYLTHILIYNSNLHLTYLYILNCLFCTLSILYICILLFVLSVSCHSVTLWSFCHYNTFLVCANTPGNQALSDCVSSIFTSEEPFLIPCSLWSSHRTQPWKIDVFSYCPLRHPTVIVSLNSCGINLDILLCLLMQLQLKKMLHCTTHVNVQMSILSCSQNSLYGDAIYVLHMGNYFNVWLFFIILFTYIFVLIYMLYAGQAQIPFTIWWGSKIGNRSFGFILGTFLLLLQGSTY